MGDAEYLSIFQQIILPMAYEFSPELVIVSAGDLFGILNRFNRLGCTVGIQILTM
jgi:hypothetical protein